MRNFFSHSVRRSFQRESIEDFDHRPLKTAKTSFAFLLKLVCSPLFQCAVIALLIIVIASDPAFAQGLGGGSESGVEDTARKLFDKIFNNWRVPFTGLGLLTAGIVALSDDVRGPGRAIKIAVVVIGIALIPSILRVIAAVSGTNFQ